MGVVSLALRRQSDLRVLVLSPLFLAVAVLLNLLLTTSYPILLNAPAVLFLCIASALWGCVVVHATVDRRLLLVDRSRRVDETLPSNAFES